MTSRPPRKDEKKHRTAPMGSDPIELIRREMDGRPRISLLIYHADGAEMALLFPEVPVVIGRDSPADVRVPDVTLSREHARFALTEGRITVEDLRSTNGTWVAGEKISVAEVKVGDEVILGGVLVCVHAIGPSESNLGLESEERFRVRLHEEVVRAHHFRTRFAVLMVRAISDVTPATAGVHVGRWAPAVRSLLRPVDRMALYSPEAVQVLLPDVAQEAAIEIARSISSRRRNDEPRLVVGVALYPSAATTAEKLIELSRSASAAGSLEQAVQIAPIATWVAEDASARHEAIIAGAAMQEVIETAVRVAKTRIPVILQGETGTGKEVLARLIHEQGPRRDRPMVCVNCGALAPQLVESTLFGHERGAFTSANQLQKGVFEEADGGTVFLDEIGELPLPAQVALLRVLETQRFTRVGSSREIATDVRILAATHRDLEAMCEEGTFRDDLYYRMNTMTITIPPLRERVDEIESLSLRFLRQANDANHGRVQGFAPRALMLLQAYRWPGNVRELKNAIERAVVIARSDVIRESDLPARVRALRAADPASDHAEKTQTGPLSAARELKVKLLQYESKLIHEALRNARWNQTEAAKQLGMPLRTLVHKIKVLGIKKLDP